MKDITVNFKFLEICTLGNKYVFHYFVYFISFRQEANVFGC